MNEKLDFVRANLKAPVIITGSRLLTGGIICFLLGILTGVVLGILGKGTDINIAIGSYNGCGNHDNGCDNAYNDRKKRRNEEESQS